MNLRELSLAGLGRENGEIEQNWGQRHRGLWLLNRVSITLEEN